MKHEIHFTEVLSPIIEPVTKFGGQPVWINEPTWPLSASLEIPMTFVAQIELTPDLVPKSQSQLAYLFVAGDGSECWDHNEGENCVILQSHAKKLPQSMIPCPPLEYLDTAIGPTVYRRDGGNEMPVEFAVTLTPVGEQDEFESERQALIGPPTLGGKPVWLQDPQEIFDHHILQINSYGVPFHLGIGTGYLMVDVEGTEAAFLWQAD